MKFRDAALTAAAAWCVLGLTSPFAQPAQPATPAAAPAAPAAPAPAAPSADLTVMPAISHDYTPKKTQWGEPDFRGSWPLDNEIGLPFQRDPKFGNRVFLNDDEMAQREKQNQARSDRYAQEEQANRIGIGHWAAAGGVTRRTSFIIDPADGRLPAYTDEGKRRSSLMRSSYVRGQTYDWVTDFDSWDRCITRGMPASMYPYNYNNGVRIFQSPGIVAINLEMVHETRIVPTDGRPGVPSQILNWLGESRGHWEGRNTLVVETTNLKPGPSATNVGIWGSPRNNDTPVSEHARIVERLTMTGPDDIVYEMTYSDPTIFTKPWTTRSEWRRDDSYKSFEYNCHEGDEQIRNYITSSRAQRAQAAAAAAAAPAPAPAAPAASAPPAPVKKKKP